MHCLECLYQFHMCRYRWSTIPKCAMLFSSFPPRAKIKSYLRWLKWYKESDREICLALICPDSCEHSWCHRAIWDSELCRQILCTMFSLLGSLICIMYRELRIVKTVYGSRWHCSDRSTSLRFVLVASLLGIVYSKLNIARKMSDISQSILLPNKKLIKIAWASGFQCLCKSFRNLSLI